VTSTTAGTQNWLSVKIAFSLDVFKAGSYLLLRRAATDFHLVLRYSTLKAFGEEYVDRPSS